MDSITLENIEISKIRPYENNPRHNDKAVEFVANSIKEFGFKVPIIIDKNNVIVAGHTRYLACKMLGINKVPCVRATDLTDEQVRAFRLADNKVSEYATWDMSKLSLEMADIDIDMEQFGFEQIEINLDPFDSEEDDDDGWYGDERERTNRAYNLDILDHGNLTNDFWQMPTIRNDGYIPRDLIGFNYAKTSEDKACGIHFYVDDYQFERVWSYPEKYVDILKEYECILSPDFSLYMDMPMPMKIWNTYRSRQIGAFYQAAGVTVIPTLSWAEPETYEFCFRGIEKGWTVSVSTVGVKNSKTAINVWNDGMKEALRQTEPSTVLLYGGNIGFDFGDIKVVEYKNHVTEDWK